MRQTIQILFYFFLGESKFSFVEISGLTVVLSFDFYSSAFFKDSRKLQRNHLVMIFPEFAETCSLVSLENNFSQALLIPYSCFN